MIRFASLISAAALALLSAMPAMAQSYGLRFQNNSGAEVYRIYSSPTHSSSWEQDLLGANVLQPGQYLDFTMHNVSNCYYDVLIEFSNGASFTDLVDVCVVGRYIIN